jgi:hypothetical protein
MSQTLFAELAPLLQLGQGVLYVYQEDTRRLRMLGSYAFRERKSLDQYIELGQGLVGQPMIHRLAMLPDVAVWPFDPTDARVVLAEVYTSLLARAVAADPAPIKDEAQVRL